MHCVYVYPCPRVHLPRKDMCVYLQTTGEGPLLISSNPEIPLCHNKAASPVMERWSVLPSGSYHEELADGGCSCSQVGAQAGDWLAFPLDQAHLSGEFTVRPFHVGSLWGWAATGAKSSHFPPALLSPRAFFPPHLNPIYAPGCYSAVKAAEKVNTFQSVFNQSLTGTLTLSSQNLFRMWIHF